MKPIATDTYTFSELIARGVVYVDKTDKLQDLIAKELAKRTKESAILP